MSTKEERTGEIMVRAAIAVHDIVERETPDDFRVAVIVWMKDHPEKTNISSTAGVRETVEALSHSRERLVNSGPNAISSVHHDDGRYKC